MEIKLIILNLEKKSFFHNGKSRHAIDLDLRIFCTKKNSAVKNVSLHWGNQTKAMIDSIAIQTWDEISTEPGSLTKKLLAMPEEAAHFIVSYENQERVKQHITQKISEKTALLPNNASAYERVLALTTARLSELTEAIISPFNLEKTPTQTLPWLAWLFSVDEWDPSLDVQSQRNLIRNSVKIHSKKGTRAAIEKALLQFGSSIEIKEWWENTAHTAISSAKDPYSFTIYLNLNKSESRNYNADKYLKIKNTVNQLKPVSTKYNIALKADLNCKAGIVIIGFAISRLTLNMELVDVN